MEKTLMFKPAHPPQFSFVDEIYIQYWRSILRLTRLASQAGTQLASIQDYLWLPRLAFAAGLIVGIVVNTR